MYFFIIKPEQIVTAFKMFPTRSN